MPSSKVHIAKPTPKTATSFLEELADRILEGNSGTIEHLTILFPNRRAGTYFLKILARKVKGPCWAPKVSSMEDFIINRSPLALMERYTLVFRLYSIYKEVFQLEERFDQYFFWGEMLINDFDEMDKYLVDAQALFIDLGKLKELESLDYLDEDQKEVIRKFWSNVNLEKQEGWNDYWQRLGQVYARFQKSLAEDEAGYLGMIYQRFATSLKEIVEPDETVIFAGFNALNACEEKIITYYLQNTASSIYWDYDPYYMAGEHEAGAFLRKYREKAVFSSTFITSESSIDAHKKITVTGATTWVGQARAAGHIINQLMQKPGWKEESTAIILPDEKLLLPLLNSLPAAIRNINITMGMALNYTTVFSLLDNVILMQRRARVKNGHLGFYFKYVVPVVRHPFFRAVNSAEMEQFYQRMVGENILYMFPHEYDDLPLFLQKIFNNPGETPSLYLLQICEELAGVLPEGMEKIFLNTYIDQLVQLTDVLDKYNLHLSVEAFHRLFRQVSSSTHVPFSGEPVQGLQIMGTFETRNLDFEHVIMLGVNEDYLPKSGISQSFIPYSLRKAFNMPTFENNQATQAYVFYRLLQHAKEVHIFYKSAGEVMGGEPSRYIQQLKYSYPYPVTFRQLNENVSVGQPCHIEIKRDKFIDEILTQYTKEGGKVLTPTALDKYLRCKLRFYFNYIVKYYEPDDFKEEVDALLFGNILHRAFELIYTDFKEINAEVINQIKDQFDRYIDQAFVESVDPGKQGKFVYEGKNILIREMIKKMMLKILAYDQEYAPFKIQGVELGAKDRKEETLYRLPVMVNGKQVKVNLGGVIDRVDEKDGVVRILDYKTGRDERRVPSLEGLFNAENNNRNKAAFQVMTYACLYHMLYPSAGRKIQPGIFNKNDLFNEGFIPNIEMKSDKGYAAVEDFTPFIDVFLEKLTYLLEEILNTASFTQTEQVKECSYCTYKPICQR
ncbi:MAG: PD-(D/E)XK nuclease family protein [Cyclobacteriaceae bacterium]|nr:PD-(D/E)XK nuclease family protein [Cyclobacteriaceae bacterium]